MRVLKKRGHAARDRKKKKKNWKKTFKERRKRTGIVAFLGKKPKPTRDFKKKKRVTGTLQNELAGT